MELFELIRRDHYVEGYIIRHIARQRQVHRRLVRQALGAALPPPRKASVREPWVLTRALRQIIDSWLAPCVRIDVASQVEPLCEPPGDEVGQR